MKSRRNFIQKGSLAALAFVAVKPFKTFASTVAPVTGFSINNNKLVLVHAGNSKKHLQYATQKITSLKKSTGNLVVVQTGKPAVETAQHYCDVSMVTDINTTLTNESYRIVYKGDIKVGVIKALAGEKNTVQRINTLSAYLKKEKDCQLVVCLSQLGFKNKVVLDDIKLAQQSTNVDVIIGGHLSNFSAFPFVAQNTNKAEVIIQSATDNGFALGNIEIEFDNTLAKKSIAINNLLTRIA